MKLNPDKAPISNKVIAQTGATGLTAGVVGLVLTLIASFAHVHFTVAQVAGISGILSTVWGAFSGYMAHEPPRLIDVTSKAAEIIRAIGITFNDPRAPLR